MTRYLFIYLLTVRAPVAIPAPAGWLHLPLYLPS